MPPDSVDARVVARALGQFGVIDRAELLAMGVTDEMIRHRLATGRLFRIHNGVYSVVPPSMLSRNGRYLAAALAGGPGTLVNQRCAAALHQLRSTPTGPIEIIVPGRGTHRRAGLRIHSTRNLHPDDIAEVDGIPCTSWARTFVDCAATGTERELTRMVEKAMVLHIFDAVALDARMDRASGKKGIGTLRRVLDDLIDDPPNTSSDFERDLLFLVAEYGLLRPVVNGWLCGYQVDFHWPEAKLVVEADDRATHATPIAFERDRERDLTLELAGWRVFRISARQLRLEPRRVAAAITAKLGACPVSMTWPRKRPDDCDGGAWSYAGGVTGAVAAAASMRPAP